MMMEKPRENLEDSLHIPDGLSELLHNFAVAALAEQPRNLYDFASGYFLKLKESKANTSSKPMYIIVDDDGGEPDPDQLKKITHKNENIGRRKSVSAERYNPEDELENDADSLPTYPKSDKERFQLKESIKSMLLFRMLDDEQLMKVIDAMAKKTVAAGETIIKQGDDGDFFYVIDNGIFDIYVNKNDDTEKLVTSLENKGSFGELALMYSQPRSATVKAKTDGLLWSMDRKSFQAIIIRGAFNNRKMYQTLLSEVPFLKPLNEEERNSVVDGLYPKVFYDSQAIITAGEDGDGMYFIEDGSCSVKLKKGDVETEIKKLNKGQYFGELALLDNSKRTASIYAIGRVKCGFLARDAFERLLGPCRDIMERATVGYEIAKS